MTGGAVLVDAGRSAVVPDGPGLPEMPSQILESVINALLVRSGVEWIDVGEIFLADPRYLPDGSAVGESGGEFDGGPFGARIRVSANSVASLEEAVTAVESDPSLVAVVAACDFGAETFADRAGGGYGWLTRASKSEIARCEVRIEEALNWVRSSYARSSECSRAGDFAREIVSAVPDYSADSFLPTTAAGPRPARGASAVILTSPERALQLGVRYRAVLHAACYATAACDSGDEWVDAHALDEILATCGVDAAHLDQLEVPEYDAVTPLGWIKATGINPCLVNPRGGDLGFGRLFRSGQLRSLVSMVHSLEATGGRTGALLVPEVCRTVVVALTAVDPLRSITGTSGAPAP